MSGIEKLTNKKVSELGNALVDLGERGQVKLVVVNPNFVDVLVLGRIADLEDKIDEVFKFVKKLAVTVRKNDEKIKEYQV